MTLLDALRPVRAVSRPDAPAVPRMTTHQFGLLLVVLAVLLAGVLVLLFGPARGLRNDIGQVNDDLAASRQGIYGQFGTGREQLSTARVQLAATEQSLVIQERGLQVAVAAEKDATAAARATQQILDQTREALTLVREVTQALGPLDRLDDRIEESVRLARAALRVAEQTLSTGQQALAVARDTLATLKRSEQVQREQLATARATLEETREINRKIPGAPVFPTAR